MSGFWTQQGQPDPKRMYRLLVIFPNMPNGGTWYAKSVTKPKMSISKTEHKYLNHTFKYPGSVTWSDVSVTLIDPVSINATQHLVSAIAASGYVIPSDYTKVTTISKSNATAMMGRVQIIQIDETAGGASSASGVLPGATLDAGFAFVQIGRASIRNPDFVNHLAQGLITESDCDHCNRCVAAMDAGGVYCVSSELGLMLSK